MIKSCLTHYDLDGVSCAIVLNKVFEFDQILRGGYGRIPELIDQIPDDASIIVSDLVISESDYEKLLDKSKGKLIIIDHHPETNKLKEKYPKHPIYYAEDKADGTVVPCSVDFFKEIPLGNLYKKSLDEIWNSPSMDLFRLAHRSEFGLPKKCKECYGRSPIIYMNKVIIQQCLEYKLSLLEK